MEFKKFPASRIILEFKPTGGLKNLFSTCPSVVTKTTNALFVDKETNSMCFIEDSILGAKTKLAPEVNPDRIDPTLSKIG